MTIQQIDLSGPLRNWKPSQAAPTPTLGEMQQQKLSGELTVEKMRSEIEKLKRESRTGTTEEQRAAKAQAIIEQGLPAEETYRQLSTVDVKYAEKYAEMQTKNADAQRAEAVQNATLLDGKPGAPLQVPMVPTQERAIPQTLDAPQLPAAKGMITPGNIKSLWDRPILNNPDGSYSTTSSASYNFDGKETLLPTVVGGRRLSEQEAIDRYRRTGEHLGQFDTPDNADAYAQALHEEQARIIGTPPQPQTPPGTRTIDAVAAPNAPITIPSRFGASIRIQPRSQQQNDMRAAELADEAAKRTQETQRLAAEATATNRAPVKQTLEEQTAYEWLKNNPGKTLNDYQTMDTNRKRPVTNNTFALNNPKQDDSVVKYMADQVQSNPLNWNMVGGNKVLQDQVRQELATRDSGVNRLTAATRQLGETADAIVPKIDKTIAMLDNPKFIANLGPVMGRWNEFLTGKVGTNDPDLAHLRATLSLIQTGTMRAHVGARGSGNLLEKFEGLVDGKKMDAATLKGSLAGIREFLQGYRDAIHPKNGSATSGSLDDEIMDAIKGGK